MLRWFGARKAPDIRPTTTDDPLATFGTTAGQNQIYLVNRINPLFRDVCDTVAPMPNSSSSGYGGSLEQLYAEHLPSDQNLSKPIKNSGKVQGGKPASTGSGSSGILSVIPEGRTDLPIPRPVWPPDDVARCDSDASIREILIELLNDIGSTLDGNRAPDEVVAAVEARLRAGVAALRATTEGEMRRLCADLADCRRVDAVLKAFGTPPSSGDTSTAGTPRSARSSDTDDAIYQSPSSSSGFSEVVANRECDSIRNALIYGTLYRARGCRKGVDSPPKRGRSVMENDGRPSVWEQYYGMKAVGGTRTGRPTDVPLFPGGRPEADFTLDVPRSEMLSKKMKEDKKWRCRCRLLTSFLGLIFFLLSVMAVSLILTRGRKMFGSMM